MEIDRNMIPITFGRPDLHGNLDCAVLDNFMFFSGKLDLKTNKVFDIVSNRFLLFSIAFIRQFVILVGRFMALID